MIQNVIVRAFNSMVSRKIPNSTFWKNSFVNIKLTKIWHCKTSLAILKRAS